MKKEKILLLISILLLLLFLSGCSESTDKVIGDAPDFSLKTLDGRTIRLSDFQGKVVLLDFMGVDCPFCRDLMDELVIISNTYPESKLEMISIDVYTYETEAYLQSYINWYKENKEGELDWTFGLDKNSEIAREYVPEGGVPKVFIIDQKGNIYYTQVGYTQFSALTEQIDKLI